MDEQTNGPAQQPNPPAPPPPPLAGQQPVPATPIGDVPPAPDVWGAPAPPVAAEPPKRRLGLLVAAVVIVALAVTAIIAFTGDSAGALPDEFAGTDKVDSGPVAEFFESFSGTFEEMGMELELGIYGSEMNPRYMIMVISGDAVTGSITDQFSQGFVSGMGAQVDMDAAIEDTVDGIDFVCMPAEAQQFAATGGRIGICIFQEGDTVVTAMALQDDQIHSLLEQTKELQAAMN
jgi:hypothetical protein